MIEVYTESIYSQIVNKYGPERQMRQTQEECGELVAVINQFIRGRKTPRQVASEVADVSIMCDQMKEILGQHLCEQERRKKLRRIQKKLL